MYGPMYHLKYLFTSAAGPFHDLNRLEYLSANAILQDTNVLHTFWPAIPVHFVKALFHTCIFNIFVILYEKTDKEYDEKQKCKTWILTLKYLVQNWPLEEFVLKDLLPMLYKPPKHWFYKECDDPMEIYCAKLTCLRSILLSSVVTQVLNQKNSVNVIDFTDNYDFLPMNSFPLITQRISRMLLGKEDDTDFINGMNLSVSFGCKINISNKNQHQYLQKLINLINNSFTISLPKVILFNDCPFKRTRPHVTSFIKLLVNTDTKYLSLSIGDFSDQTAQSIGKTLPDLHFLYIEDNTTLTTLEFLSDFTCLKNLGLTGINLCGKLYNLRKMSEGLQYLRLWNCYLEGDDLVSLIESSHVASMKQFDVELKTCTAFEGFLKLCPHLASIEVLTLKTDKEWELGSHQIERILKNLSVLAKLEILALKVSTSLLVLMELLPLVVKNLSLKVLNLSILNRSDISDITKDLIEELKQKTMKNSSNQNKNLEFSIILSP